MKKTLQFFEEFTVFEAIGNMSFSESNGNSYHKSLRQIKASEVTFNQGYLEVSVEQSMVSYLRNRLSPIIRAKKDDEMQDTNKLFLALALTKIYFEEKDQWLYFPLVSLDLSNIKEDLLSGRLRSIKVDFDADVVLHDAVINAFFDFSYNDFGTEKTEYIGEKLSDLVHNPIDLIDFSKNLYEKFKKSRLDDGFELLFPEIKSDKSVSFMFFNLKENVPLLREYKKIMENPSQLLERYLTSKEPINREPDFTSDIWSGSLTKDFPLGAGQSKVMQRNELNDELIAVQGAPGTGKTTLFLSIIAQEVTKRALTIAKDLDDYNNMMIVTSTSNKAIENVFTSLQHGFKHGNFVYVGGNSKNKEVSTKQVQMYKDFLIEEEFSNEKFEHHKAKLLRKQELMEKKRNIFNSIKEMNLPFKNFDEAVEFANKEVGEVNEQKISLIRKLLKIVDFEHLIGHSDLLFWVEKTKPSIMKIFSSSKIVRSFNEEFTSGAISQEDIHAALIEIEKIKNYDSIRDHELQVKTKKAIELVEEKHTFFNGILKNESYNEYFRTNLFKMNYDMYISSLNLMHQYTLKNKVKVLKAIEYFLSENPFKYVIENYKDHNEFLKYLSLAYPVTTSTLAAINGMFSIVKKPFNLILADEAGMIASHSMIPILNRSNRAIVVGDPKQLEPIVPIHEIFLKSLKDKYSDVWDMVTPSMISAFHRSAGTIEGGFKATGSGIVLDEHRRCAKKIAELFIEIAEYEGLKISTLPIKKSSPFYSVNENLFFFHTKNSDTESSKKINFNEISQIGIILNRFEAIGYDLTKDVGIITPYRDQESELIRAFGGRLNHVEGKESKIGTVHKFQGVEYKVMIFSSVISRDHDNLSFINSSPSLINVAISRTKEIFCVVGDYEKLTSSMNYENFAGRMANAISKKGKLIGVRA